MQNADYQSLLISNAQAITLAETHFGIVGTVKKLPGFLDLNFYLKSANGEEYILKITRPNADLDNVDLQNEVMRHLEKKDLPLDLPKVVPSLKGNLVTTLIDIEKRERTIRLYSWVPGRVLAKVNPHTTGLLESWGRASGLLCKGLEGFDHPAAHEFMAWDVAQVQWIKEHLGVFEDPTQKSIVEYFLQLFESQVLPKYSNLRKSVIHCDANDYNVLASKDLAEAKVTGIIDFGDAIYSQLINDLAITLSYSMMHKEDPLASALPVVKGFHEQYPLEEKELEVLFPSIAARLLISVTASAQNRIKEPDNEYLFVSERPAWDLLKKLRDISPNLAHYAFRSACGWEACPKNQLFKEWLESNRKEFAEVVKLQDKKIDRFDLSVGSLDLGHNEDFEDTPKFQKKIKQLLEEKEIDFGIGGYAEPRPVYTTDAYLVEGNEGPQWRTIHLGLDIWGEAETPVFAAYEGVVHSFQDNAGDRNYGPTIILEHSISDNFSFYTLYGHLGAESLEGLKKGMPIQKGQQIATIGNLPQNGNWPPHLHFQVMLDMLGWEGDFPGVAFPSEQKTWLSVCPNPVLLFPASSLIHTIDFPSLISFEEETKALLGFRQKVLGKNLSVSYKQPLHITRAYKQYLFSNDGRRYLDTVNNVPHVGHQHPKIVRAAQKQAAVLNTNARYLHETILEYANDLLAMFPEELSVCYFVNSGSEANELALRMARNYTKQQDMIAIEVGYHGNTTGCIDLSSYKFDGKGGQGAPNHTHIVPIPDAYRGIYRKEENDPGKRYASHIQEVIENLEQEGKGIAGFISESILSCGGQVVPSEGYLKHAFELVRKAGGLCISDEVQVGFGRVGDAFWGFELQDVVPEIVTLGKPIGNGHPLGAVVTTAAVAEAFNNGMEFFSTFGGNPVSCAIGQSVLQIVKEEGLQQHAKEVGDYLKEGLQKLMRQYPIIGDVRGHGLFLGFELVESRQTLAPATAQAAYLKNRMRQLGILMSTDGPFENVLKIKPPMCFDQGNADFLLKTLEKVLKEDFLNSF